MKLFFSRLDKSDSSSPPESPEIDTEEFLNKDKENRIAEKNDELSKKDREYMRRGDLRIQERYKEGEKKIEEEKMKNYLTTRNGKIQQNKTKQSGKMRNKIQQLPLENLRKMFREDMKNCEDIWTGRKKGSHKHNVFQDVVRRDELLHRRSHESVFTKDQKLMLQDESSNRWMRNAQEREKNIQYINSVLLFEFCVNIYQQMFNIGREEAVEMISFTPPEGWDEEEEENVDHNTCILGPSPTKTR